jgi:N-acetylmuramoyl-L-alanine amidase
MKQKINADYIIVIDPAGDAKKTGRSIDDSFERGIALQCAEKIKALVEQRYPKAKVIITRLPGDIVYDLQNASLTNRINANLFINLNFYPNSEPKPSLFLYQFSYGNDFTSSYSELSFNSYEQAYKINQPQTSKIIQQLFTQLADDKYAHLFSVSCPHAIPVKPLIGVIAPSIALDIGLKNKNSWHLFIEPLADAIIQLIHE